LQVRAALVRICSQFITPGHWVGSRESSLARAERTTAPFANFARCLIGREPAALIGIIWANGTLWEGSPCRPQRSSKATLGIV
jgi:hypothetical protein